MLFAPHAPAAQKSKIVQIVFETFNVPIFLPIRSDVAALYPNKEGMVASFGHDGVLISQVQRGLSIPDSCVFLPGGGQQISEKLAASLSAGSDAGDKIKPPLVEEIKTKLCFASPIGIELFRKVWSAEDGRPYSVVDDSGRTIVVDTQRFSFLSHFFQRVNSSFLLRFEAVESVYFENNSILSAVAQCSENGRPQKLFVVGKSSLFPGLADRLRFELRLNGIPMAVEAPHNRGTLVFSNAAAIASRNLSSFITKEEYDEHGPNVIAQKADNFVFA